MLRRLAPRPPLTAPHRGGASRFAALALLALLLLGAACDDGSSAPGSDAAATPATPTPETEETPTVAPTTPEAGESVASTASIPTEDLPRVRFRAPGGQEAELPVETPPRQEYTIGLSGRTDLEGRGMLFYYPSGEHTGGFWMRDTHIDLDIAFVDDEHEVIEVLRMEANTEEIHHASQPYLAAIEAPAGWYEEHGIDAGAHVEFLFEIPDHLLE